MQQFEITCEILIMFPPERCEIVLGGEKSLQIHVNTGALLPKRMGD